MARLILCGLLMQVGAMCRDQGHGRDSSLEVIIGPRDFAACRARQRPPNRNLGSFDPDGNSLDPARQPLEGFREALLSGGIAFRRHLVELLAGR